MDREQDREFPDDGTSPRTDPDHRARSRRKGKNSRSQSETDRRYRPYLTGDSSDVTFTIRMIGGCYVVPAYEGEATAVFTNHALHDSYRGAARPEATLESREQLTSSQTRWVWILPIRLINFVPKSAFPYDIRGTGFPTTVAITQWHFRRRWIRRL